MERLTYQDKDGGIFCPWERNSANGSYDIWDEEGLIQQINRLAAYEDTGLTPEEIERIVDAYGRGHTLRTESAERLEIVREIKTGRLRELVQAEQDGRMVVLPSKTVWELTMDAGPDCDLKCPVDAYDEALGCDLCSKAKPFAYERPCTQERLKGLGKTVFLTREEAEAAMKEDTYHA